MSTPAISITTAQRNAVVGAALLVLFLGALDALIMSAAMPSIVSDLGGMHLFSWVYSAYFLSRAVSLPIFGKLADLYKNRELTLISIGIFVLSSLGAGFAWDMTSLIAFRVVQGVGAGGVFALTYIVLADVSPLEKRGKILSLASSVWGIASVLGPTLGGFIVTNFSWRWIFFINVPMGMLSFWGIGAYLMEMRVKKKTISLDFMGVATLTLAILSFLFAFMLGGRSYAWNSPFILILLLVSIVGTISFIYVERHHKDPILSIGFFRKRGFSTGNATVFLSSMAIFSLFAFAPLFLQGVQGHSPNRVGLAMLWLSLGWSLGAMAIGQVVNRLGPKPCAIFGAILFTAGSSLTLILQADSPFILNAGIFFLIGVGMGFLSLSSLLVVQASVKRENLGVATASNQFARTLGGTVGIGICGSFIATHFFGLSEKVAKAGILNQLPAQFESSGSGQIERFLDPAVQASMSPELKAMVHDAVNLGITKVFWMVSILAGMCLFVTFLLPKEKTIKKISI